ncbi:ANK [Mytilus edulis]|uniref:ANK n=1 Tax=Mytilus edulis TaxID=6550 RepID=A0A8S3S952_MYTED|nr:ANK [Mytilus edulis]
MYALRKPFFPLAVLGGSLEIVKELILSGADVNCFSEFWETPLYIAAKSGRCDMVRLLVENRAQLNKRGWFEIHLPSVAISTKHELTSFILTNELNQTELHEAVRRNNLENLKSNIRPENINSRTKSGWTVLHYAVLLDNLAAVEVLFHEKLPQNDYQGELLCSKPTPKVNIADNYGLTAVHLAVMKNNIEILSLLLNNKGKVKVRDVFDRTPLHYIVDKSTTQLLITHCSRNQQSETNGNAESGREYTQSSKSAFKVICFNTALKTSLRYVGRDVINMPDIDGNTPLHSLLYRDFQKRKPVTVRNLC